MKAAVFLDKDGTIVEDVPFNADPARLRFAPNALAGLRLLARIGLPLVIVTNQPGLATGRIARPAFALLQQTLRRRLRKEAGVTLAGWYTCPHAPDARAGCRCRKPAPGLLRRAASRHGFALECSWMIGDILDDVEAGRRAGCTTVLLDVGNETVWRMSPMRDPHYRRTDLLGAAELVAAHAARLGRG